MKTNNPIHLSGSVLKQESLVHINSKLLDDTFVAEANSPYSDYYGQIPKKAKPNSLFLFTSRFYFIDEILHFSKKLKNCTSSELNVASAVFQFRYAQMPAIRIKNIQDYSLLKKAQECLKQQGVEFAKKIYPIDNAWVMINKCFVLNKAEEGIYIDAIEENKGYILPENDIDADQFAKYFSDIKNNSSCKLFDAVQGRFIINSQACEMVRIYSEGLDIPLLQCIKKLLSKHSHKKEVALG